AEWLDPAAARALLTAYREWGAARELSAKRLLMPLRVALTGREHGPELHFVLAALDRSAALDRLHEALARPPAGPSPGATSAEPPPAPDPSSSAKGARP
ncbi:MAG: hypothetical protein MUF56_09950, partial [Solirubrobacteraceae bacterium]|nr:hypothetical protein [Solirubrobacteraceae bacterium]